MNTMGPMGKAILILGCLKRLVELDKTYYRKLRGKAKGKVKEKSMYIEDNKYGRRGDKCGNVHVNKPLIDTLFWPNPGPGHHSLSSC